jgi:hypothetical protein
MAGLGSLHNRGGVGRYRATVRVDQGVAAGGLGGWSVVFRRRTVSAWRILGGCPPRGAFLGETRQPLGGEAVTPETHGLPTRVERGGNVLLSWPSAANEVILGRRTSRAGVR